MKVEIFHKNDVSELQKPINDWLKEHPKIHVEHVTQSQVQHGLIGPKPTTICIWYT